MYEVPSMAGHAYANTGISNSTGYGTDNKSSEMFGYGYGIGGGESSTGHGTIGARGLPRKPSTDVGRGRSANAHPSQHHGAVNTSSRDPGATTPDIDTLAREVAAVLHRQPPSQAVDHDSNPVPHHRQRDQKEGIGGGDPITHSRDSSPAPPHYWSDRE